jgi:hypothetical protein
MCDLIAHDSPCSGSESCEYSSTLCPEKLVTGTCEDDRWNHPKIISCGLTSTPPCNPVGVWRLAQDGSDPELPTSIDVTIDAHGSGVLLMDAQEGGLLSDGCTVRARYGEYQGSGENYFWVGSLWEFTITADSGSGTAQYCDLYEYCSGDTTPITATRL